MKTIIVFLSIFVSSFNINAAQPQLSCNQPKTRSHVEICKLSVDSSCKKAAAKAVKLLNEYGIRQKVEITKVHTTQEDATYDVNFTYSGGYGFGIIQNNTVRVSTNSQWCYVVEID